MNTLLLFVQNSFYELRDKVIWPTPQELEESVVRSIVAAVFFTGLTALVNMGLRKVIAGGVYSLFS
jgi:preprotein translocase subunit SecE